MTMTPTEFTSLVMPEVVDLWSRGCLCQRPGFLKLISFDFRKLGLSPVALFDLETICQAMILARFPKTSDWTPVPRSRASVATYLCPDCGTVCHAEWEDYSVSFSRTAMTFDGPAKAAAMGACLVGFHGYGTLVPLADFRRAPSVAEFLVALAA